ncbi:hypothetical protein GGQ88_001787 [Novosphingobium hassiacum]|uniref:YkgJ family cysteine cluster protein n=1 Tax=Novosphingobium hassiacum TaxID=173676 RepID=A0A7W6EVT2_9SPHN|nr:hypothetical protein [Novosphingobium hassiacum]MBB3860521.1 hypothetical protein [Novosphingobium hassiacum]
MAEDAIPLASRLCLACGMCCDGTLHDYARLRACDIEPATAVGLPTFNTADGLPAMPLPCQYLDGAACRRYDDWRPSICGEYQCQLQLRAAAGECTEAQAMDLIASALAARDRVIEVVAPGTTLTDARKRFGELAASKQALSPADARLVARVFALERVLDPHFRKPGARGLATSPGTSPND